MPIRAQTRLPAIVLGDIADDHARLRRPAARSRCAHQAQAEVIALGVSMAKGGDIIALGHALARRTRRIAAQLPVGIELAQVQDQPRAVSRSVNEFVRVLIEAVVIVLAVSFISLGLHTQAAAHRHRRPGLVVGITIPLVLAITFVACTTGASACTRSRSAR